MRLKKREYGIIGLVLLLFIGIAWAVDESVTVSSTAVGLTAAKYGSNRHAMICVEGNAIRFTLDGITTPTSGSTGVGIKLEINQCLIVDLNDHIKNFKAIRNSATDATIRATYW